MTTKHVRKLFKIIQIRMRSIKRGKGKQWSLQTSMNSQSISHSSVSSLPFLRGHQTAGTGERWQRTCLESSKLLNTIFLDSIPWKQIISYLSLLMRRAWQPTLIFLPGESHGQRSLAGTVHGVTESDTGAHPQESLQRVPMQKGSVLLISLCPRPFSDFINLS